MVTTHYRCILDIVQSVENPRNRNIDEYKKNLDENIENGLREIIFGTVCDENATVTIERLALEIAED